MTTARQPTVDQMARDVTQFLPGRPTRTARFATSIGSRVVIFLLLLTIMLIALKREVWAHLDRPKKTNAAATARAEPAAGGERRRS